jgi:hypothetical protein
MKILSLLFLLISCVKQPDTVEVVVKTPALKYMDCNDWSSNYAEDLGEKGWTNESVDQDEFGRVFLMYSKPLDLESVFLYVVITPFLEDSEKAKEAGHELYGACSVIDNGTVFDFYFYHLEILND